MIHRLGVDLRGDALLNAVVSALGALRGTQASGIIKHDVNAATVGVVVKVAPVAGTGGRVGFLNAINAGAANANVNIGSGGPAFTVVHAAAPAGTQLYYNETKDRYETVAADARDIEITGTTGVVLRVYHNANAATEGVAVYFDDDAANVHERLRFVSAGTVDGPVSSGEVLVTPALPTRRVEVYQLEDNTLELHFEAV